MANTTAIMTVINKEFKRRYAKGSPLFNNMNRQYDERYQYKGAASGESIQIKVPQQSIVHETMIYQPQNNVEKTETLTRSNWAQVGLNFSAAELSDDLLDPKNLKLFADDFLQSAVDSMLAKVHFRASEYILQNTYNNVGTPGTQIANHQVIRQAAARLTSYSTPTSNRSVFLQPDEMGGLNYGMSGLQNGAEQIGKQLADGFVYRTANFDFYETPHLSTHTRGTATNTTPLTNSVTAQTGTSLIIDGTGSAVTFKKGDHFTIAGVKAVNPLTKEVLPFLQDFVITADVTSDSVGSGNVTLSIFPEIITSGQYQNVSNGAANDKAITLKGDASTQYVQGIAMHKDAFTFATQRIADIGAPFESTFMEDNFTFKLTLGADVYNMTSTSRIDMKWGIGKLIPSGACIIYGDNVP